MRVIPIDPTAHQLATNRVNVVEADCDTPGYTGDVLCELCGEVVESGETVDALGHTFVDGICTVCGEEDPSYVPPFEGDDPADQSTPPQTGGATGDDANAPTDQSVSSQTGGAGDDGEQTPAKGSELLQTGDSTGLAMVACATIGVAAVCGGAVVLRRKQ